MTFDLTIIKEAHPDDEKKLVEKLKEYGDDMHSDLDHQLKHYWREWADIGIAKALEKQGMREQLRILRNDQAFVDFVRTYALNSDEYIVEDESSCIVLEPYVIDSASESEILKALEEERKSEIYSCESIVDEKITRILDELNIDGGSLSLEQEQELESLKTLLD